MTIARVAWRRVALVLLLVGATGLAGCARLEPPRSGRNEQPYDRVYSGSYATADSAAFAVRPLPRSAYKPRWFFDVRTVAPRTLPPRPKIHPALRAWIDSHPPGFHERLMVTFVDTLSMPRLPARQTWLTRHTHANFTRDTIVARMIQRIALRRGFQYEVDTLAFAARYQARVLKTYWLLQAALVEMPLGRVDQLAADRTVRFIRLDAGGPPPQFVNTWYPDDVRCARNAIGSDHYFDLGLNYGWAAILDTGVYTDHDLLSSASLCMVADCYGQDCLALSRFTCDGTVAGADRDPGGHGTCSAAILTGQTNDPAFRGVTTLDLDCFTVYDTNNRANGGAAFDAFQLAAERGNPIILAETAEPGMLDVRLGAENAYALGSAVIAANGNDYTKGIGDPATSPRVLGVGAYNVYGSAWWTAQAWGPTAAGRFKPELIAPSQTQTAGVGSPTDLKVFGGTSGAAPYAAGAASLLRNWMMIVTGENVDPGQVYAHLILSGDQVGPFKSPAQTGAGKFRLPPTGTAKWGKAWVSETLREVVLDVEVPAGTVRRLNAAIWWPETTIVEQGPDPTTIVEKIIHNQLGLEIVSPGFFGSVRASSASDSGVVEKARVDGSPTLDAGLWHIRIKVRSISSDPDAATRPQAVYWCYSLLDDVSPAPECAPIPLP